MMILLAYLLRQVPRILLRLLLKSQQQIFPQLELLKQLITSHLTFPHGKSHILSCKLLLSVYHHHFNPLIQ